MKDSGAPMATLQTIGKGCTDIIFDFLGALDVIFVSKYSKVLTIRARRHMVQRKVAIYQGQGRFRLDQVLKFGLSINAVKWTLSPEESQTLFNMSVYYGNSRVVDFLLRREDIEVDPNCYWILNKTYVRPALHQAVVRGHVDVISRLLQDERVHVDVNKCDDYTLTPLDYAVECYFRDSSKRKRIIELLIANPRVKLHMDEISYEESGSLLHYAICKKEVELFESLIHDPRIDINRPKGGKIVLYSEEKTVLYSAVWANFPARSVKKVLDHPDIDVNNQGGSPRESALHFSAGSYGDTTDIIELLMAHPQIDMNPRDHKQRTPLHIAAECGNARKVECLLRNERVLLDVVDDCGYTPLELAKSERRFWAVWYLKRAARRRRRVTHPQRSWYEQVSSCCLM